MKNKKNSFLSHLFFVAIIVSLATSFIPIQIFNTSLTITVRDETGNTVEGAFIKLFETEKEYNEETHVVAEGTTNSKGVFRFKGLKAISYFVLVRKDDKDNQGGGEKISTLKDGSFNKINIIIQ